MALTSALSPSAFREPDSSLLVCLFVAVLSTFFRLLSLLAKLNLSELFFLFYMSLLLCINSGACEGQKQMVVSFLHHPESTVCSLNNFACAAGTVLKACRCGYTGWTTGGSNAKFWLLTWLYIQSSIFRLVFSQGTENGRICCISLFGSTVRAREATQKSVTGPH